MEIDYKISELVLNMALNQYSIQWTRAGNLQSSSGILFTFVSLIETAVIAIITQSFENLHFLNNYILATVFYTLFFSSILFMIFACVFMLLILKTKQINGISNPVELQDELDSLIATNVSSTDELRNEKLVNDLLITKINGEIEEMDSVMSKNRRYYSKCMVASIFSFVCSFSSLLFVCSPVFSKINIVSIVPVLLGGLIFLGVFLIFFFQKGVK